jgi:hypothetical protein
VNLLVVNHILVVESDILRVQQVLDGLVEGVRGLCDSSSHDSRRGYREEKRRMFESREQRQDKYK